MKMPCGAFLLASLPALAQAQGMQVPAVMEETPPNAAASASASANAGGASAGSTASASPGAAQAASMASAGNHAPAPPPVPAKMPPPIPLLSPSAKLNAKEQRSVALAARWAAHPDMPQPGEDGVVRFLYGATLPTVVCAPLQVCDLVLQPGEIVNNINVGDKVRWLVMLAITGAGGTAAGLGVRH